MYIHCFINVKNIEKQLLSNFFVDDLDLGVA